MIRINAPRMTPELEQALEEARTRLVTDDELREQRISFAYGNGSMANDLITKDTVRSAAASARVNGGKHARRTPYTERGISRAPCFRCGAPGATQFQICADDLVFRPVCIACDVGLNELVLRYLR